MNGLYFKRDGSPAADYADARGDNHRVAEDTIDGIWVSTVHLGLDHQYGAGPPLIFETMLFRKAGDEIDYSEIDVDRYSTEADALAGHARFVERVKAGEYAEENTND